MALACMLESVRLLCGGRAVGKARVLPEVAEHFEQMRFTAAEKAADPCSFLIGLAYAVQIGAHDLLQQEWALL